MHPYAIGELALGLLRQRQAVFADLRKVPNANVADHNEVLRLIEALALHGRGIGYVDSHLLASAILTPDTQLWSRDRRPTAAAGAFGFAARLTH
jgi:predicted nucleic acid-binding protein